MDPMRPDEGIGRNIPTVHETDSSDVLSDRNAELSKEKDTAASAQIRAAGNSVRLTQKPESKGAKDPSSSQKREASQTLKEDNGKITTGTTKSPA